MSALVQVFARTLGKDPEGLRALTTTRRIQRFHRYCDAAVEPFIDTDGDYLRAGIEKDALAMTLTVIQPSKPHLVYDPKETFSIESQWDAVRALCRGSCALRGSRLERCNRLASERRRLRARLPTHADDRARGRLKDHRPSEQREIKYMTLDYCPGCTYHAENGCDANALQREVLTRKGFFFADDTSSTTGHGHERERYEQVTRGSFEQAWAAMEAKGYQYGEDALEQVRLGWEMARGQLVANEIPSAAGDDRDMLMPASSAELTHAGQVSAAEREHCQSVADSYQDGLSGYSLRDLLIRERASVRALYEPILEKLHTLVATKTEGIAERDTPRFTLRELADILLNGRYLMAHAPRPEAAKDIDDTPER